MASLILCLLALQAPGAQPAAGDAPLPLIVAVDLDANTLLAEPGLVAAGTLALKVESRREAYFKLSEQGDVLAAGRLLPGANALRFTRPGLADASRTLLFRLELLADGGPSQKTIRVAVTTAAAAVPGSLREKPLSGSFTLEMLHDGERIGLRRKRLEELYKLDTGTVVPVPDQALAGSAIRSQAPSQGLSVLGVAMALAKYLAGKKAEKRERERRSESQKKRLALTLIRDGREVPILIELKIE